MGGKNQTERTTQDTTGASSYTPAGLSQLQDIWGRVQQVASQPYTPYGGPMVADLNATQQRGIGNIDNAFGSAQPYFDQAAAYGKTGAAAIDPNDIQRYISPYTQNVVDATQRQFTENNAKQQQQITGNAAMRGALGGDRVGVAQAEATRQQKLAQDPVIAGLYNNAYTQALGAAQGDRSAAAQGAYTFGALAPSVQNAQIQGGQAQIGAGSVAQGNEQQRLSAAYQQYLQAMAFPYQQAGFLTSAGLPAVSGMGGSGTQSGSQQGTKTTPGPSPWGQIAGLGLTAAGLFTGNPMMAMGGMGSMFGGGGSNPSSAAYGSNPFTPYGTTNPAYGWRGGRMNGNMARGGRVGMKRGGRISDDFAHTVHAIRQSLRRGGPVMDTMRDHQGIYVPRGFADGGDVGFDDRFAGAYDPASPSSIDPMQLQDSHFGQFGADPTMFAGATPFSSPGQVPLPVARPVTAGPVVGLPPQITNPGGGSPFTLPPAAMGYDGAPPSGGLRAPLPAPAMTGDGPMSMPGMGGSPDAPVGGSSPSGGGLFGMSEEARLGLLSAGLGMMSSKSPFALTQIGEGGLHGVKTYAEQKTQKQRIESEARRLTQQAEQFAKGHDLGERRLTETHRHNTAAEQRFEKQLAQGKVPPGMTLNPDGSMAFIKGGPHDPAVIETEAKARKPVGGVLDDETVSDMAGQYLAGDKSVMQNLGRGAQGSENIIRLRQEIGRQARDQGMTPDQIATKMADFAGRTAAMRTLGTRGANVEYAANTAYRAIDLAEDAMKKVPRTQFVPFNQLRQLVDKNLSSPEQAAFYAATNTLVNEYARIASGGSNQATEGMRHHAREMLNTAMGPTAYKATLDMMRQEIKSAKAAYDDTRKEFLADRKTPHGAETPTPGPAASSAPAPARPSSVPVGSAYSPSRGMWRDPKGKMYDADGKSVQ